MADFISITSDYYAQLAKQGDLFDCETINTKQLKRLQKPVVNSSLYVLNLALKRSMYLAKWEHRNLKRCDRWANSDKRRADKLSRTQQLYTLKQSERAVKLERKNALALERKQTRLERKQRFKTRLRTLFRRKKNTS